MTYARRFEGNRQVWSTERRYLAVDALTTLWRLSRSTKQVLAWKFPGFNGSRDDIAATPLGTWAANDTEGLKLAGSPTPKLLPGKGTVVLQQWPAAHQAILIPNSISSDCRQVPVSSVASPGRGSNCFMRLLLLSINKNKLVHSWQPFAVKPKFVTTCSGMRQGMYRYVWCLQAMKPRSRLGSPAPIDLDDLALGVTGIPQWMAILDAMVFPIFPKHRFCPVLSMCSSTYMQQYVVYVYNLIYKT